MLRLAGSLIAIAAAAITGFVGYQVLAADRPVWTQTLGDLMGQPRSAEVPDEDEPSPISIEFIVNQCSADGGPAEPSEFRPPVEPESAPARLEDLIVAPDAVLPSLETLLEPSQQQSRAPVEVSASIVYLP